MPLAPRLRKDAEGAGYAVESGMDGQVIGFLALFDETLVELVFRLVNVSVSR